MTDKSDRNRRDISNRQTYQPPEAMNYVVSNKTRFVTVVICENYVKALKRIYWSPKAEFGDTDCLFLPPYA